MFSSTMQSWEVNWWAKLGRKVGGSKSWLRRRFGSQLIKKTQLRTSNFAKLESKLGSKSEHKLGYRETPYCRAKYDKAQTDQLCPKLAQKLGTKLWSKLGPSWPTVKHPICIFLIMHQEFHFPTLCIITSTVLALRSCGYIFRMRWWRNGKNECSAGRKSLLTLNLQEYRLDTCARGWHVVKDLQPVSWWTFEKNIWVLVWLASDYTMQ